MRPTYLHSAHAVPRTRRSLSCQDAKCQSHYSLSRDRVRYPTVSTQPENNICRLRLSNTAAIDVGRHVILGWMAT